MAAIPYYGYNTSLEVVYQHTPMQFIAPPLNALPVRPYCEECGTEAWCFDVESEEWWPGCPCPTLWGMHLLVLPKLAKW